MSLALRAVVAIALTVVFYVFAVAVMAGLIAFPILRLEAGESVGLVGLMAPAVAITMVVKLVPRRDRFTEPGPRVTRADQPELVDVVEAVARAVGHPAPDATYLDADINAGVFELRPTPLSRRRVLVVGLPLLEVLTVAQLRAILAHEFGHYVAGDTRIGRWTYRTRQALLRVATIHWASDHDDDVWLIKAVRWPFQKYTLLFLRVTSAIARRQELAADLLAARVVGIDAYVGALRRTAACRPAFEAFWEEHAAPALLRGLRPPLGEGFRAFLSARRIDEAVQRELNTALERDVHDPYDSHPTLRQRLAALGAGPHDDPVSEGPPASSLVRAHSALEAEVLRALAGDTVDTLRTATWGDVEQDWLRRYAVMVDARRPALAGLHVRDVPALAAEPSKLVTALRARWPDAFGRHADVLAREILAAALTVALVREGFVFAARPGAPLACSRGEHRFVPFLDVAAIAEGRQRGRVLFDRLLAAGVGEAPLVEATADQAADAAPAAPRVDHERADEPVPADARRERPSRPRRALAGLGRTYAVAWTLLFVLLLLAGPGMIIGYDVAGRPGEAIGALILPAAIGAFLVHRRRRRGTVAS